MNVKTSLLTLLLFSVVMVKSQTTEIKGEVRDGSGVLSGVVITIMTEMDDDVISYTVTDHEGRFSMKKVDLSRGRSLHARLLGYASTQLLLEKGKSDYTILLTEKPFELHEVTIKAAKITGIGDTTRYLVSSFAKQNDITLGDILKRMPGFQVSDDGKVKYGGKEISDFFIEGSNIMGDKYPVAVKSILQDDVGSVEVLNNHQSIKLFENLLYSDKTAVNITLKEKAKNQLVGLLKIGGGIPKLWNAEINALRFAPKIKMLNTYKGNNTGNNVSAIGGRSFNLSEKDAEEETSREMITMRSTRNAFLEERKTLFNQSHLLSLNTQIGLSKSLLLTPQFNYSHARIENNSSDKRTYYLEEGKTLRIAKEELGTTRRQEFSPIIRLDANTAKLYLNNQLSGTVRRKTGDVFTRGTYPNIEASRVDYLEFQNQLDLLYRIGDHVIGVKSKTGWSESPQEMKIQQDELLINEKIKTKAFYSHTSTTQTFLIGRSTLSLDEGVIFSRQSLQSQLSGVEILNFPAPFQNTFNYWKTSLYVKPTTSFNWGAFRTSLQMQISYNYNNYFNKQTNRSYVKSKILLSPSVSAGWKINNRYNVSLSGGWKKVPETAANFYSSPLLTSYPFTNRGIQDYNNEEMGNIGGRVQYANILYGFFWNLYGGRRWQQADLMVTQDLKDPYIVRGLTRHPHHTKADNLFGSMSYMFDLIKGGLTLKGVYSSSDTYFVQNGTIQHAFSNFKEITTNIDSSPLEMLDLDYIFSYSKNELKVEKIKRQSTDHIRQSLSITLKPTAKLNLVLIGNHYYNTVGDDHKNTFLLDLDLNYTISPKWHIHCSAQNMFNQKEFSYLSSTEMVFFERKFQIRPFSLLFTVRTHF